MAFAATSVWEVRTTGSDSNGGGFDPSSANMAADLAATSGNTASPVVTSASYTFLAGDVGAWVFVKSGTNWLPGWYKIASVAAGAATLTAGVGTAVSYGVANVPPSYNPNTTAGVASVASPTLGTWAIDYSQQNAAQFAYTDLVIDATTNTIATSAAHPIGVQMVGNIWNITAGTGWTVQRVQLVSVSAGKGTFDKALGTLGSTGGTGNMGGALLTSATVFSVAANSNTIWWKAGTYSVTVAPSLTTSGTYYAPTVLSGYDVVRGDNTLNYPIFTSATNSITLLQLKPAGGSGNVHFVHHIKFTHTAVTKGAAIDLNTTTINVNSQTWFNDVFIDGCANGFIAAAGGVWTEVHLCNCTIQNCTGAGMSNTAVIIQSIIKCFVYNNGGDGIAIANNGALPSIEVCRSIFASNTGIGFGLTGGNTNQELHIDSSTLALNTSDGLKIAASAGANNNELEIINCCVYGNGGFGLNAANASAVLCSQNYNNAFGSNTSGNRNNLSSDPSDLVLTVNPFNSSGTGDFSPNATAGGGAVLRAAGSGAASTSPGSFPGQLTSDKIDVGGAQHTDAGAAAGMLYVPSLEGI